MWIDYAELIRESEAELATRAKQLRGCPTADRVKMLRLLKTKTARSRRALAPVLGYSERQLQRWWDLYQAGGVEALLEEKPRGGSTERVAPEAWAALEEAMRAGRIARLKDAQAYLSKHFGIAYQGVTGLSRLFRRHRVKLKTGRRRHLKADAEAQGAFKKAVRRGPERAPGGAGLRHRRGPVWVEDLAPEEVVPAGGASPVGA